MDPGNTPCRGLGRCGVIRLDLAGFQYRETAAGVFDLDLSIKKGECVVVIGPSGNGKTTLTRLINGLAPAYYAGTVCGRIEIAGVDVSQQPLWVRGRTVGSVFQDPGSQFFSSELPGEVAFACENYGLPQQEIVARTDEAIERFGLAAFCAQPLDTLSSGEKQRTAAASVYALQPSVYVCDEPTANLDEQGITGLRNILVSLKQQGCTLLIAEHRLAWLMEIADRFVYLRNGRIGWERTPEEMLAFAPEQIEKWGLRAVKSCASASLPQPAGVGTPVLAAENLCCRRGKKRLQDGLNFQVWPGQIVAITGRNGVGKTTLAKIIAGLERPAGGVLRIGGEILRPAGRRRHCWYGANDTGTQFFTGSVTGELLAGLAITDDLLEHARVLLKHFGLYGCRDQHPATLSGGQKQRLSIACGLLSGREILLFDEPTSGLDGGNMRCIASAFSSAGEQGKTVLIVTHDRELIDRCCSFCLDLDLPEEFNN